METKRAEIEGLTTETEEDKGDDQPTLGDILERTMETMQIEHALNQEALKIATGTFSDDVIYNIPRKTSNEKLGKADWGAVCDKIGCPYKGKELHVHTLGVNIVGATKIANAYGDIDIVAETPQIKELTLLEGGLLVNRQVWQSSVKITNKKTNNSLVLPYQIPVMTQIKTGYNQQAKKNIYSYEYNEYGFQICLSKNIRNAILAVIPENIKQKWIDEYCGKPIERENPAPKSQKGKKETTTQPPATTKAEQTTVPELDQAIVTINACETEKALTEWFAKNGAWLEKQKPVDKQAVMGAYNQRIETIKSQSDQGLAFIARINEVENIFELENWVKKHTPDLKSLSEDDQKAIRSLLAKRRPELQDKAILRIPKQEQGNEDVSEEFEFGGEGHNPPA